MAKIKKVLSDYEEVIWHDPKHASWFETLSWFVHDEMKEEGKKTKATAFLMRGLPMIPLTKFPMKDVLNLYDRRAQIMLNYFKHAILPGIPENYMNRAIEETAFISEDNKEAIKMLSDSSVEVHIGSTGTPKEVIKKHLEICGIKEYVSSIVGNSMKIDSEIEFNIKYADRKGKYRIMKEIKGKLPYDNLAIIDDEPDIAKIALEEAHYNGGLVRIMKSRKNYKHPYFEVGSFKEFADLVISQE